MENGKRQLSCSLGSIAVFLYPPIPTSISFVGDTVVQRVEMIAEDEQQQMWAMITCLGLLLKHRARGWSESGFLVAAESFICRWKEGKEFPSSLEAGKG